MTLRLAPVPADGFEQVRCVRTAPEHERFAGTVAEAFEEAQAGVEFHGIFQGDRAVGFFKIDRLYPDRYPFARAGELGLRAFIVDRDHHGQGIGTQAVRALPGYLRAQYPDAPAVVLSVNFINAAAIACYLKGGFTDTGEVWPHGDAGPQHVMRLGLRPMAE